MRRLDHAGIFLMIAGTYTPVCLLAVKGEAGQHLLIAVWIGAALGSIKSVVWVNAPKALFALLCVIYAWAVLGQWTAVHAGIGDRGAWLLLVGGVLYTTGAVIYALKRPDPFPATFGYHEIFHVLVIAGAVCHFFIVTALVLPA
jgi:hemolysin III